MAAPIISIGPFSAWSATIDVTGRARAGWVDSPLRIAVCVNMAPFPLLEFDDVMGNPSAQSGKFR
jgi:hypothetical protein